MGILGWLIPGMAVAAIVMRVQQQEQQPGGPAATLTVLPAGGLMGAALASIAGLGEPTTFFVPATWAGALAGAALTAVLINLTARVDLTRGRDPGS